MVYHKVEGRVKDVVEITESSGKVEFYVNGVIDKEVSKEIVGAVVTKKIE